MSSSAKRGWSCDHELLIEADRAIRFGVALSLPKHSFMQRALSDELWA